MRCLYKSDICTSPMFVPVRHLHQSDVCTSATHCGSKREKTEKSIYSNNMHVLYIKLEVFWVVESEFGVKITIAPL